MTNVYIVYNDAQKSFADAERFGALKQIFSSVNKKYHTFAMIEHARRVLENWKWGDYLLMVGDPTLCAVCMTIVAEHNDQINVLRWDKNEFKYQPQTWSF